MSDTFELSIEEIMKPRKEIVIEIDLSKVNDIGSLRRLISALEARGGMLDSEAKDTLEEFAAHFELEAEEATSSVQNKPSTTDLAKT